MSKGLKRGDLILTPDGYYGIYLGGNDVFLGNGLTEPLPPHKLDWCIQIPIRNGIPGTTANFEEILKTTQQSS